MDLTIKIACVISKPAVLRNLILSIILAATCCYFPLWAQKNYIENTHALNLEMVFVKGGTFMMGDSCKEGSADEQPVHPVTLRDYYIGKTEITNAQFCIFLNENGNKTQGDAEWIDLSSKYGNEKCRIYKSGSSYYVHSGYEDYPVIYVSWYGARAFAKWLSEQTSKSYSLPTEAQWEYAAKGGAGAATALKKKIDGEHNYSGSTNVEEAGWYDSNSNQKVHAVAKKKANAVGIYDMSGNVMEWCQDRYGSYGFEAETEPCNDCTAKTRVFRVLRGGGWEGRPLSLRCTARTNFYPDERYCNIGFRICALSK